MNLSYCGQTVDVETLVMVRLGCHQHLMDVSIKSPHSFSCQHSAQWHCFRGTMCGFIIILNGPNFPIQGLGRPVQHGYDLMIWYSGRASDSF